MKIQPQKNDQLAQLCELIEPFNTVMLTTLDENGALASRPMAVLEVGGSGR